MNLAPFTAAELATLCQRATLLYAVAPDDLARRFAGEVIAALKVEIVKRGTSYPPPL